MGFAAQVMNINTVVTVNEPRLDAAQAPMFKAYLSEQIANGASNIVLDLSNVVFIDSSGLGAIVSVLKDLQGVGEIKIAAPGKAVSEMLRLTRMDKVFKIFETVDEANEA